MNKLLVIFLLLSFQNPVFAERKYNQEKLNRNYSRILLLAQEVEILRQYMGRPLNIKKDFPVVDATPRDVYFQASTLFKKTDKLTFEQVLRHTNEPSLKNDTPNEDDVYILIDSSLKMIYKVKKSLNITEYAVEKRTKDKTPVDVYKKIIFLNRQINLMLDYRAGPSDVYQKIGDSMKYVELLFGEFNYLEKIKKPKYVSKKIPRDVYRKLLECMEIVHNISKLTNSKTLKIQKEKLSLEGTTPGDVLDIASIVHAELINIHSRHSSLEKPIKANFPGRKFPSDVFQLATHLEKHLYELELLFARDSRFQ